MASLPPWVPACTPDNSSPTGNQRALPHGVAVTGGGGQSRYGRRHLLSGRTWEEPRSCPPMPLGPLGSRSTLFIEASYHSSKAHTWHPTGRQPSSWAKSKLNPRGSPSDGSGSDLQLSRSSLCSRHPHPLPPSSLVSSPTDPGPATASAHHPQGCSHGAGDSTGELGCNLQGSRNATFPGGPIQEAGDKSEGTGSMKDRKQG